MPNELTAVIDLGSNSIRLVIYEVGPHGTQTEVDDLKQVVRLNNYLDADHVVSEKGIGRTVRTIRQFKALCEAYHVAEIIGVATQAVRMAANQAVLLERILEETGIAFRVITGEEEARYGYLAVVNTLPFEQGITVDVGGGSTEITYFYQRRMLHWVSVPHGAVSLTREYILKEPPSAKDMKTLERAIRRQLRAVPWLKGLQSPVIGIGGTARAIARMHQQQSRYSLKMLHGYQMWPTEVTAVLDMVRSTPVPKRSDINGLSSDRADVIVAGISVIDQVIKHSAATRFVLSSKGLRDGVLLDRVLNTRNQDLLPDILLDSIENLIDHFHINREHAFHVWRIAAQLFSEVTEHQWLSRKLENCLRAAALLHDIGRSISIYNTDNHNFYLLLQVPIFGLSHRERIITAAIASFKTPNQIASLLARYPDFLDDEDIAAISQLGVLLGLARALDRAQTGGVQQIALVPQGKDWRLVVRSNHPLGIELSLVEDWLKKARKVFQQAIQLEVRKPDHADNI